MSVFMSADFKQHENVVYGYDQASGLKAIIAIHSTRLGPALGGCRMFPYVSEEDALKDVLRLSRGMTYKAALANLPLGGGKAVIIGDPGKDKTKELFLAMGNFVDRLHGAYVVAQDSGIAVEDLEVMGLKTNYVAGTQKAVDDHKRVRSGDPSPATAYGVFVGIKAALKTHLHAVNMSGISVAIQGVGNVGFALAKHLHAEGVRIFVADVNKENVKRAVKQCGAIAVAPDEIYELDVDVFSPCALGGAINQDTLQRIHAPIIAGSANNQLQKEEYGQLLQDKGILYAPDFVISAGGVIHVQFMRTGRTWEDATHHVETIGETLEEIFTRARADRRSTAEVALQLAEERLGMNSTPTRNKTTVKG